MIDDVEPAGRVRARLLFNEVGFDRLVLLNELDQCSTGCDDRR